MPEIKDISIIHKNSPVSVLHACQIMRCGTWQITCGTHVFYKLNHLITS